jgi:hypothetical protein
MLKVEEWEIQKCRVSSGAILEPTGKNFDGAAYQVFTTIPKHLPLVEFT